ncbi:MAG TPA: MarR family transcriptional regulator [Acidimicrobiales bacterium]|nr:MarR family transcriptional regulator [Acidimicrobiales bacterium]
MNTSTPHADLNAHTAARLQVVVSRLMRAIRFHGAAGLTPSQMSALAALNESGPVRISHLASRESVGAPAATRVVASLEEMGLVRRAEDPEDKRAWLVELSDQGRRTIEELWKERTVGLSARLATLSGAERDVLDEALPVLEKLARDSEASPD